MHPQRTEGIILRSVPYQDYDQILTLYTPHIGVLPLIVKGAKGKRGKMSGALDPLTLVECVYRERGEGLAACSEIAPIDAFPLLRSTYTFLESGCNVIRYVHETQMAGKSSLPLYQLLLYTLRHIPTCSDCEVLALSFKLKLQRHEGLLHLGDCCLSCTQPLERWYLAEGETYCKQHAPPYAISLTAEEAVILTLLATSRSLKEIDATTVSHDLKIKLHQIT